MEEARSLVSRPVKIEYAPQRTANEILALAFELLWSFKGHTQRPGHDSVQGGQKQDRSEGRSFLEVMR